MGEIGNDGLQTCDETPAEDAETDVDVRGDEFVEEDHPFEGDVGDVESCEEPVVLWGGEGEGSIEPCDAGIAYVAAIEE